MDSNSKAILKTLLYADLFDYPLTKDEVYRFLISEKSINRNELLNALKKHDLPIEESEGYLYLIGREELVEKRKKREEVSRRKLEFAKKIINKISFIPSIKLIGISGGLSMKNCDADDDIDLFVITDKGFAWTTRFLLVALLTIRGIYRNRNSKNHSNKICLNMLLDESRIEFIKPNKDLYTAHEIVQLLTVFNKGKSYEKFINANVTWVKNFIPNFEINTNISSHKNNFLDKLILYIFRIMRLENLFRFLQLNYMKSHKTREVAEVGFLKFHPYDYKIHVLKEYEGRLSKMGYN